MALRPESVDEWCQLMPNLLEEEGWNEALVNSEAALMHASCPWGGHLIKLELKGITINDAPAKTGNVLVRPEVRAQYQEQCPVHGHEVQSVGFVAPGEAVVEASTTWAVLRLCSVLFGDMAQQVMNYFFRSSTDPVDWHQKVRRDFPKSGDSACTFWKEDDDEQTRECLVVVRPETADKFTAFVVARTHEDRFARWATGHFGMVLSSARSTAESYLNRPGIVELRKQDEQFYVVLSMQSFKRGMPLLPALPEEKALTDINAGKPFGLSRWVRYEPESGKFFLFEYLEIFIQRLGFEVQLYDSLDGQKLVPYMCVLRRDQWEVARSRFMEAYPLQKTAYRHANGGSGAPGVHDDVPPKFMSAMSNDLEERLQTLKEPRLVVKNTFLDVEEEQKVRPSRRPKTTALGKPVLAH